MELCWQHFRHCCGPVEIDEIHAETAGAAGRVCCTRTFAAGKTGGDVVGVAEIDSTADTVAEDRNYWPPAVAVGNCLVRWKLAFPRDWRIAFAVEMQLAAAVADAD